VSLNNVSGIFYFMYFLSPERRVPERCVPGRYVPTLEGGLTLCRDRLGRDCKSWRSGILDTSHVSGFPRWPPGQPRKPKFLRMAVVIIYRLVAVQGRDTSVRDDCTRVSKSSNGLVIPVRIFTLQGYLVQGQFVTASF
jgi:hypothetical protein